MSELHQLCPCFLLNRNPTVKLQEHRKLLELRRHSESVERVELGSEVKTSNLHQQRDQRETLLLRNDFIWSTGRAAAEP